MTEISYSVALEIDDDGKCMAHVLDLPGCTVRAADREEALQLLPSAIREYHDWLRFHGEAIAASDRPVEIEMREESRGFGPFDPGDAAALFLPDREPVSASEMDAFFRWMVYSRLDLLALLKDISEDVLDWQPDAQSFSIRRILRHIGNAEEWYVSRLASPETLPPEWEKDETLDIFPFMEMERFTAVSRLKQLNNQERSSIFYPAQWTQHPDEPWTARKVFRRFLEHEREHTAQIREILQQSEKGLEKASE